MQYQLFHTLKTYANANPSRLSDITEKALKQYTRNYTPEGKEKSRTQK